MISIEQLAALAHETFSEECDKLHPTEPPSPQFKQLDPDLQHCWIAAAKAVYEAAQGVH